MSVKNAVEEREAHIKSLEKNLSEAKKADEKKVIENPENAKALFELGTFYRYIGKNKEAMASRRDGMVPPLNSRLRKKQLYRKKSSKVPKRTAFPATSGHLHGLRVRYEHGQGFCTKTEAFGMYLNGSAFHVRNLLNEPWNGMKKQSRHGFPPLGQR